MSRNMFTMRDGAFDEVNEIIRTFRVAATKAQKNNVKNRIFREVVSPLAEKIKMAARASDGQSRIAADSVKALNRAKPTLVGGYGGGLAATLFWGAEFGGQSGKMKRTARISKDGEFVRRATTMQFRKWRGGGDNAGYWFHPVMRRNYGRAASAIWKIVNDEVLGDLLGTGRNAA